MQISDNAKRLIQQIYVMSAGVARSAINAGPGATAQENGVAAGAGGVAVRGDVHGPVIIAGAGTHITVTTQDDVDQDQEPDAKTGEA